MSTAIAPIRRAVPTLIHLHGGAFVSGRKNSEARPLIYRLASQGWLCISANYRLSPAAAFPDHLIDVKKVIAWVREHGQEYGADPAVVFVAGSSAGAHLAALAALTPNDPAFQPGFELPTPQSPPQSASTATTARSTPTATPLVTCWRTSGPVRRRSSSRTATGTRRCLCEDARRFVESLRSTSSRPVVYAELPGAQHSFDLFHSLRFEALVDAIEAFAAWVRSQPGSTAA